MKHPYWVVRLMKICDNSQSDYLPSISRLVTCATRLTLNSFNPNMLEIIRHSAMHGPFRQNKEIVHNHWKYVYFNGSRHIYSGHMTCCN